MRAASLVARGGPIGGGASWAAPRTTSPVVSRRLKKTKSRAVCCSQGQEQDLGAATLLSMASEKQLQVTFGGLLPKNIEQLKMLNAAIFPIKYQDGFYRECCAAGDVTQLAYHNDVLVGAVACRFELQPDFSAKVYIMTIGVLAPYRGMGLGRQLMERSLAVAKGDPNVKSAYLHVQAVNKEAADFYKKFGFEETEVVRDYYKLPDGRDALILSRSLVDEPPTEQAAAAAPS